MFFSNFECIVVHLYVCKSNWNTRRRSLRVFQFDLQTYKWTTMHEKFEKQVTNYIDTLSNTSHKFSFLLRTQKWALVQNDLHTIKLINNWSIRKLWNPSILMKWKFCIFLKIGFPFLFRKSLFSTETSTQCELVVGLNAGYFLNTKHGLDYCMLAKHIWKCLLLTNKLWNILTRP